VKSNSFQETITSVDIVNGVMTSVPRSNKKRYTHTVNMKGKTMNNLTAWSSMILVGVLAQAEPDFSEKPVNRLGSAQADHLLVNGPVVGETGLFEYLQALDAVTVASAEEGQPQVNRTMLWKRGLTIQSGEHKYIIGVVGAKLRVAYEFGDVRLMADFSDQLQWEEVSGD
jgi:hypothetical protein